MTQRQTGLTFNELLIELIQAVQEMFASSPGQDFPCQSLLVIFPESVAHGFHYAGGRSRNIVKNCIGRETNLPTSALTL